MSQFCDLTGVQGFAADKENRFHPSHLYFWRVMDTVFKTVSILVDGAISSVWRLPEKTTLEFPLALGDFR
jgi:hypothetical protein